MSTLITFLHVLVCLLLVGTVLLQQGKGGGMGGAFGGGNAATVFGSGGASTFLRRLTAVAATVFMLTSMVLAYISSNDAGDALRSYSAQQTQIKKRKKDAESRALDGTAVDPATDGAGDGTGTGTGTPTGADVNDGDTGEDEAGSDGADGIDTSGATGTGPATDVTSAAVPSVIDGPAEAPAPAAVDTARPSDGATPTAPAPTGAAVPPAAKKPAAKKPAATKPAVAEPAPAKPAPAEPAPAPAPTPVP